MAVIDTILTAQLKLANLVLANIVTLQGGGLKVNWKPAIKGSRGVYAVSNRLSIGDTSSSAFKSAYACLQAFVGNYGGGAIDPNAQNPGLTIDVNNTFVGTNVVRGIIPFNQSGGPVQLSNYNNTLKYIYGNNLITLDIFLTGYSEDESTAPTITYLTPSDPTTDITNILWDYPPGVPVSGYILIAGVVPVTGTPAGGGGGSVPFPYSQTDLAYDGTLLQWYLPLTIPTNKIPLSVEINGVSTGFTFDRNTGRIYSFADNTVSQSIIVYIQ